MKENIILNKSILFSVAALNYCQILFRQKQVVIANQLSRAALAIGANISEAQQAESRIDFIHKIKLTAKETSEVPCWLELCRRLDEKEFRNGLMNDIQEINAILSRIIITAKKIRNNFCVST